MGSQASIEILTIGLGCIVLVAGRNVFWLVIGLIGFLFGVQLGQSWLADQPIWLIALAAAVLGVLGAVLAIVFERVAFALAGFYLAAYLAAVLSAGLGHASVAVLAPLIAGVIGAIIAALLTDWVIIVLSALAGSAAVVSVMGFAPSVEALVFSILALAGIIVQYAVLSRHRRQSGV